MNLAPALHQFILANGCGTFTPLHCGPLEKPHLVVSKLGTGWRIVANRTLIFEMDGKGDIQFRSELVMKPYRD